MLILFIIYSVALIVFGIGAGILLYRQYVLRVLEACARWDWPDRPDGRPHCTTRWSWLRWRHYYPVNRLDFPVVPRP